MRRSQHARPSCAHVPPPLCSSLTVPLSALIRSTRSSATTRPMTSSRATYRAWPSPRCVALRVAFRDRLRLMASSLTQLGSFALSEESSGSDAFALKTTAKKNADGDWVINGSKMYGVRAARLACRRADRLLRLPGGSPTLARPRSSLSLRLSTPRSATRASPASSPTRRWASRLPRRSSRSVTR